MKRILLLMPLLASQAPAAEIVPGSVSFSACTVIQPPSNDGSRRAMLSVGVPFALHGGNTSAGFWPALAPDFTAPVPALSSSDVTNGGMLLSGQSATLRLCFGERHPVAGLVGGDFALTNLSLLGFTARPDGCWDLLVSPPAPGAASLSLGARTVADNAGNPNLQSALFSLVAPSPTPTATPSPTASPSPSPSPTPVVTTATFVSIGAEDGTIVETTELASIGGTVTSQTTNGLWLGDTVARQQELAILSFDTSSIPPGATITGATLSLKALSTLGRPATLAPMLVDIKSGAFGTGNALEPSDFESAATVAVAAIFPSTTAVTATQPLNPAGLAAINRAGRTQLRLRMQLDDNNDAVADRLELASGNCAALASRPTLRVTYSYIPTPTATVTPTVTPVPTP